MVGAIIPTALFLWTKASVDALGYTLLSKDGVLFTDFIDHGLPRLSSLLRGEVAESLTGYVDESLSIAGHFHIVQTSLWELVSWDFQSSSVLSLCTDKLLYPDMVTNKMNGHPLTDLLNRNVVLY